MLKDARVGTYAANGYRPLAQNLTKRNTVNAGDQVTTTMLKVTGTKLYNDVWTVTGKDAVTGIANTESSLISFDPDTYCE